MKTDVKTTKVSNAALWAGRIISVLPALMLIFGGVMNLLKPASVLQEFGRLGYSESVAFGIGILAITCAVIYLIPSVSVLGAILLTGYLGGAVATHVRVGDPVFNVVMPILLGVLVWGGLFLRDERMRELIPFRK